MVFHFSVYGLHGGAFRADLDGWVGTTQEDVARGRWPDDLTVEEAQEIAAHNEAAKQAADAKVDAWRNA